MKLNKFPRLSPVSINDLPGIQGWLQSMASQGFLLDCCDNGTFFFNRVEPIQRRYRIDTSKGNTMGVATPQLQDMYREFGWNYVDSYTRDHHVFYTDDPDAIEPFPTPEALVENLERVKRRRILKHLILIGSLVLLTLLIILSTPSSSLSLSFILRLAFPFILLIYLAYEDVAPLLNLTQTSENGTLLKSRDPVHVDRTLRFLRYCVIILLVWQISTLIF